MSIIKLTDTSKLQTKVADSREKVADSREKVADSREPKAYDLAKLLDLLDENAESPGKVEETSEKIVDTPRKKSGSKYNGYTQKRAEANRKWEKDQARVNLRMAPELKAKVEEHTKARGESIMGFIIRAIKEQMERDSR